MSESVCKLQTRGDIGIFCNVLPMRGCVSSRCMVMEDVRILYNFTDRKVYLKKQFTRFMRCYETAEYM